MKNSDKRGHIAFLTTIHLPNSFLFTSRDSTYTSANFSAYFAHHNFDKSGEISCLISVFKMTNSSTDTWTKWLNEHASRAVYDENPEKVEDVINPAKALESYRTLTLSKNLVLLSRAAIGKKAQATFYHSTVGVPILPDELRFVARSNLATGTGIEVDPETLFQTTPAIHVPSRLSMMNVSTIDEFKNLTADTTKAKKKVRSFALLTPHLAEAVQSSDMTPGGIFLAVLESIKTHYKGNDTDATPTAGSSTTSTSTRSRTSREGNRNSRSPSNDGTSDADHLLSSMSKPFGQVLLHLWASHHVSNVMPKAASSPLTDEETIAWEKSTRINVTPTEDQPRTLTETQENEERASSNATLSDNASTAMTNLATSLTRYQEATIKAQEGKSDNRLKAWKRIPKIQQDIILFGGIDEQGDVPSEPTEEMMTILGCQNGAQVEQYLRQHMSSHNMSLEPGLCSGLNKGIFVCPTASIPKNFTPFCTPQLEDDEDMDENASLLKLAIQEKFDKSDLVLLTKMDVKIPTRTQELRHQVKNFAGISGRCFGQDSILFHNLIDVAKHIESKETSYNYEFKQDRLFGGHFLDKIHFRVHRFLDSCAYGDVSKIATDKLQFADLLDQVESREYNTKAPAWIKSIVKKDKPTPDDNGNRKSERKRRTFDREDNNRSRKVDNPHARDNLKLKSEETYRLVFHPGNMRDLDKPKLKNGAPMCLRYHSLGFCFSDCKVANGHSKLDNDEASDFLAFLTKARAKRSTYQQQQRRGRSRNPPNAGNATNQGGENNNNNNTADGESQG